MHYPYESRIENIVPRDHCLSSLGKPRDAKRRSPGRIFLPYSHTHDRFFYYSLSSRTVATHAIWIQFIGLRKIGASKMHLSPPPCSLGCCPFKCGGSFGCWSIVLCTSHCLLGIYVGLCFGMHTFMLFLVLQLYWRGKERWLLCFYCLSDALLLEMLYGSS